MGNGLFFLRARRKTVRFLTYDQGVGIVETLSETKIGKQLLDKFPLLSSMESDGEKIKNAIEHKETITNKKNRGRGLTQIIKSASAKNSSLKIISGHGCVKTCDGNQIIAQPDHKLHLGGTLIEWKYKIGP